MVCGVLGVFLSARLAFGWLKQTLQQFFDHARKK
jgi:hypothetical protein